MKELKGSKMHKAQSTVGVQAQNGSKGQGNGPSGALVQGQPKPRTGIDNVARVGDLMKSEPDTTTPHHTFEK